MERSNDLSSPKIALLIDFDNVILGIDDPGFDVQLVVNALRERGHIVLGRCYGDWYRHSRHRRNLMEHGLELVETPAFGPVIKNSADIRIALDGYEIGMTQHHIDTFCIVSGDSDFLPLIKKLQFLGKRVLVICGSRFTSDMVRRNCNEFISYENLLAASVGATEDATTLEGAFALLDRAMTALRETGRDVRTSTLKQMMLQLNPVFSERSFGCSQFRYFLDKAVAKKLIKYGPRDRTSRELHVLLPDEDEAPLVEKFEARARNREAAKEALRDAKDLKTEAISEEIETLTAPEFESEAEASEKPEKTEAAPTARTRESASRAASSDESDLYPRYDRNARRAARRYSSELPARPLASSAKAEKIAETTPGSTTETESAVDEPETTPIIAPLDHIASDTPTPEDLQENLLPRSELAARGLRRGKLKFSGKAGIVAETAPAEDINKTSPTPEIEALAQANAGHDLEIVPETEAKTKAETAPEIAEEKPKKRAPRRRSSAKKAETVAHVETEASGAEKVGTESPNEIVENAPQSELAAESSAETDEEKPKKRTRRTAKKAVEAAFVEDAAAAPVETTRVKDVSVEMEVGQEKPKKKAAPRKRVAKKAAV